MWLQHEAHLTVGEGQGWWKAKNIADCAFNVVAKLHFLFLNCDSIATQWSG